MRKESMTMKFFRMFSRSFRDAFKSVFRNFSLSLASISCITITLIIVAVAIVASKNVEHFTKMVEDDQTIVAFVKEDFTETEELEKRIQKTDNVDSVEHISKLDAPGEFHQDSKDLGVGDILKQFNEENSPLLESFKIKVKDISKIDNTVEKIEKMEEIEVVSYGKTTVKNMLAVFQAIKKIAYGAVIALILVTVFLIINTIKLTIFSRKREISIMRLVGASNITIKTPFIIEGMVLGMLGSIVPILIIIFGYSALFTVMEGNHYIPIVQLITPEPFIYTSSLAVLIIGIIVGMIGSASAVRKYLKV